MQDFNSFSVKSGVLNSLFLLTYLLRSLMIWFFLFLVLEKKWYYLILLIWFRIFLRKWSILCLLFSHTSIDETRKLDFFPYIETNIVDLKRINFSRIFFRCFFHSLNSKTYTILYIGLKFDVFLNPSCKNRLFLFIYLLLISPIIFLIDFYFAYFFTYNFFTYIFLYRSERPLTVPRSPMLWASNRPRPSYAQVWMHGWMDVPMDGWMDRRKDECMHAFHSCPYVCRPACVYVCVESWLSWFCYWRMWLIIFLLFLLLIGVTTYTALKRSEVKHQIKIKDAMSTNHFFFMFKSWTPP